jgi:glutamate formiminotransferase/formiminotetrahydrofolate cyclodeaminase
MGESAGIPERMIIETAIQSMGLDDLGEFDVDKKVIEYAIQEEGRLVDMTIEGFCDELSSDSPAPGGGSVAALCSALSGSLTAMVANLTVNKKGYENGWEEAKVLAEDGQRVKEMSLQAIDKDTKVFFDMMNAMKLPKKTDVEKAIRLEAIQDATKEAIMIPFESLEIALEAVKLSGKISKIGNSNALSDAGVAAITANAAAKSAFLNVKINMSAIDDKTWVNDIMTKAQKLADEIDVLALKFETEVKASV